jgi:hypothetical protein
MNEWIAPLAEKERERRKRIETFKAAMPAFWGVLLKALRSAADEYAKMFPGESMAVLDRGASIQVEAHVFGREEHATATLWLDPFEQELHCQFHGTREVKQLLVGLKHSGLGLCSGATSPELTAEKLTEKALAPLIFFGVA